MTPKISLTVSCTETAQSTIYLGGKIIASGKVSHSLILSQKEGTHTLTAKCTDLVGNISERTLTFTVDISSPSSPSISYEIDKDTQKLAISIYCREEAVAEIFTHGTLLSSGTCKRNTYFTYVYKEQVDLPFYVTYTARLIDKAGNKSALNEKTVFIAAKTASVKQRMCSASYDLHTSAFNLTTCNWDQDDLEYQKTTSNGKRFESTVSVKSEKIASVALTVFTCKQKTLWDPKTWFSCVRIIAQEQKLDGQLIPILNSKEELHSVSNEQLSIYHDKVETFSVKKRYLLRFSATVGAGIISNETLSPESNTTFTPKYGSLTNTKYFSWIFSRPKEVNQWHGITAFQKPHGGIDFAVSKETILAPAKGKIISVGHAKAKVCNDGGNYLGVSHNNGLYTYYFHLASVNYGNGKAIKKGDTIEQGIKLATSGNTGQYNCEPLGAHLHFEVRKSGSASSHINPVPYFDVDWNTIVTSRAKAIPGRLTGDNPHPKF